MKVVSVVTVKIPDDQTDIAQAHRNLGFRDMSSLDWQGRISTGLERSRKNVHEKGIDQVQNAS
jgi:hypothetical protein